MESVTSPLGRGSVPSRLEDLRLYLLERARGIDTLSPAPLAITEESVGGFTLVTFSWEYGTISRPGAPRPDGFVFWTELASSLSVGFPRLTGVNLPLTARSHQVLLPPGMVLRGAVQTFRTVHRTVEYGEFVQPDDWLASTLAEAPLDAGDFLLLAGRNGTANNPIISLNARGIITGTQAASEFLALRVRDSTAVGAFGRYLLVDDNLATLDGFAVALAGMAQSISVDASSRAAAYAMLRTFANSFVIADTTNSFVVYGMLLGHRVSFPDGISNESMTQYGLRLAPTFVTAGSGSGNSASITLLDDAVSFNIATGNPLTIDSYISMRCHPSGDSDLTITKRVGLDFADLAGGGTELLAVALDVDDLQATAAYSLRSIGDGVILVHKGNAAFGTTSPGFGAVVEIQARATDQFALYVSGQAGQTEDLVLVQGSQAAVRVTAEGRLVANGTITSDVIEEAVADENVVGVNVASYASLASSPQVGSSYVLAERIGLHLKDISGAGSQADFIGIKIADQTVSGTKKSLETTDAAMAMDHAGPAAFGGDVTVPDEAYGSGWNGSLEVPTKNALYDKIETLGSGGGGITWNTEAGTTLAAAVANGYVLTAGSLTTATLPATCAVGDSVRLIGVGTKVKVTANTGQTIRLPWAETTTAGSLTAQEEDNDVELTCVVANTTWNARASGNFGVS